MAQACEQKCYTLTLTEIEAGVLLGAMQSVAGFSDHLGRREADAIAEALRNAKVSAIEPIMGGEIRWHDIGGRSGLTPELSRHGTWSA